ncbi:hypothetical protein ACN9M0_29600 [Streptomyces sp. R-07]|uniref:hypothetical protein n=1 Tax=unclassified Streptomyces TaxID=2593676 RepID=UPI0034497F0D
MTTKSTDQELVAKLAEELSLDGFEDTDEAAAEAVSLGGASYVKMLGRTWTAA